jgi:hypothetical protein
MASIASGTFSASPDDPEPKPVSYAAQESAPQV